MKKTILLLLSILVFSVNAKQTKLKGLSVKTDLWRDKDKIKMELFDPITFVTEEDYQLGTLLIPKYTSICGEVEKIENNRLITKRLFKF